ncbi:hypothetical protein [Pararhodobacter marinus]|uniref:hypothetical protein n=1 Tax=Pararhodobacter marinus TaxID=2184063 RepID=UPI00143D85C8|nr:hypothetical protein [Pararhodobacter marinus]
MPVPTPSFLVMFGHDAPLDHPALAGLPVRDVTRVAHEPLVPSALAPLLEPFLDPFVRRFLFGLEAGAFDDATAIVIWRAGPGALHAYRYAAEFRRLGLLPAGPPLFLWSRADSTGAAARAFDARQVARLTRALAGVPRGAVADRAGPLAALQRKQAEGRISGAEAFARRLAARAGGLTVDAGPGTPARNGPRLALAGAPLGGDGLHRWLDAQGALVLDLQGPDAPQGALPDLLKTYRIDTLVWQVDPQDDLHGWRKPQVARDCAAAGVAFVDLGFVPSWPTPSDLPPSLPEPAA